MFAGHIEYFSGLCTFHFLVKPVKFFCLRQVRKITSVQNERRRYWHCIYFTNSSLQGSYHIGVSRFVETDMTVADLCESEIRLRKDQSFFKATDIFVNQLTHPKRLHYTGTHHAKKTRTGPCHTLQETGPVDTIIVFIDGNIILVFHV